MKVSTIASVIVLFFIIACPCPKAAQKMEASGDVAQPAEAMPDMDHMLGAMIMTGFRGSALAANDEFMKFVSEGKAANFILFDRDVTTNAERNIQSAAQLRALTAALHKAAGVPIFIGIDQEGGQVRRLRPQKGFMDLPSAQRMGQGNIHDTYAIADALGHELIELGINLDLAPVVDVDSNPFNPAIGKLGRAFNTDPALVARHALAFGQGLAKNGVVPVLKHFPGQGCAEKDTHLGMTDISRCWNPNTDLLPYAEIFKAGWPGMVMVGHLFIEGLDPKYPATLSRNIITGLLREGLGWHGVVISDDLQMKAISGNYDLEEAIRLAVEAGIDIILLGNNLEWDGELPQKAFAALKKLLAEGKLSEDRIRQSWERISALHEAYAGIKTQ